MCRRMSEPAPAKSTGLHARRAVAPDTFLCHNGAAARSGASQVPFPRVLHLDTTIPPRRLRRPLRTALEFNSCSHDNTGIETPTPGRARAENAVAVVCALPLRTLSTVMYRIYATVYSGRSVWPCPRIA